MVKYHEIRICFFDKRFRSFMSRTVTTLKFRLRWFPEEAGYSAEKGYTDINLPPLMYNEDTNISGSLIEKMMSKMMTSRASQEYPVTWFPEIAAAPDMS